MTPFLFSTLFLSKSILSDAIFNRNRLKDMLGGSTTPGLNDNSNSSPVSNSSSNDIDFGDPLLIAFEQDEINYSNQRYFNDLVPSSANNPLTGCPSLIINIANDQLRFAETALKNGDTSLVLKICSNALDVLGPDSKVYGCF